MLLAKRKGVYAGNFGDIGCFSLHPLKNLNVWGDGGMMIAKKKILKKNSNFKKSRPCK